MALIQNNYTVGTTAILVVSIPAGNLETEVNLCNNHTQDVHVGSSTVAAAQPTIGVKIAAGATLKVRLRGGESLYAIASVAATTPVFTVLYSS